MRTVHPLRKVHNITVAVQAIIIPPPKGTFNAERGALSAHVVEEARLLHPDLISFHFGATLEVQTVLSQDPAYESVQLFTGLTRLDTRHVNIVHFMTTVYPHPVLYLTVHHPSNAPWPGAGPAIPEAAAELGRSGCAAADL